MIIDGKKIAEDILTRLAAAPKPEKFLAAVLVGDDASSVSFLAQKEKVAQRLGIDFRLYKFPATSTNDELREEIGKIAGHTTCGGVIVQLPLPDAVNRYYVLNAVPPEKDVDVLSERSLGAFYNERSKIVPPAVATVEELLKKQNIDLATKSVAVVGLGLLVGRPVATRMMWHAKETMLLRSTSDLIALRKADIVITGVGKAGLIHQEMLKEDAVLIDFGYDGGKGDFHATNVFAELVYTPVPGGTGPILVAKLFENFYALNGEESKGSK